MSLPRLRVIVLEDDPDDEALLIRELRRGWDVTHERVQTGDALRETLSRQSWDLVISDYAMPSFTAPDALAIVKERGLDVPFIIVSGTIGEETAVEALKLGASDYLLKGRLARLISAVSRELREAERRRERRRLEDQLETAQKLETIGRLAGGIAHDFNNLLTAINGYSDVVLGRLAPDDENRADVEEILKAGKRAASLTRQLLAFSRKQVLQPRVLDLNRVIESMENMLRRLIGADVELVCKRSPSIGRVRADQGQLEQVLVNLVVNARDAMPSGGRLTIETMDVELDETYARDHADVKPGAYVLLAVSDTGIGMDREILSRIFEPFFTTKEKGKGTGLGLSTVYGVVKQSGGHVAVYSEPGKGTTFKVYLPRSSEQRETTPGSDAHPTRPRGNETILVVEDEPAVRALVKTVLESNGYKVLVATDPEEAIARADGHAGTIHLLLTDVVLPRLAGPALGDLLVKRRPGLRVVFMSGYTDNAIVHRGVLDPGTSFIQKPFTPAALAQEIRAALDASG